MKKRLISALLAISLTASLAAGCGSNPAPSSGSSSAPQSSSTPPVAADIVETSTVTYPVEGAEGKKLTMWLPIQPPAAKHISSYNEQEVFQEIAKKTGIEVEFIHPALGQEKEQLGLLIAGGDLPDIIQIRGLYAGGASAGVDDGIFEDLTDLMPVYAPDYYNLITKDEMSYRLATNNDGRLDSFHILKQSAPAFNRVSFTTPIIEKYSIDPMPETISDYEALFAKMAADGLPAYIPNKNGRVDLFMFPYGITPEFSLDTNGNVQFGPYTQQYKEYLTMMNKWYTEGYLYKDFMSNISDNEKRAMFANQQVGMITDAVDLAYSNAKNKGFTTDIANYPRLEKGQEIPFEGVSKETLPEPASMTTVISADSKNKELAMQYLNYYYTQEGADLANWGIEGKAYTVDANGKKTFTDHMLNNPDVPLSDAQTMFKIHLIAKLAEPDVVCNPNVVASPESLALREKYFDDPTVTNKQTLPTFQMSIDGSTERAKIMRDITTYVDEMSLKFITGATPLSEFDSYMDTLKSMNIERAVEITQNEHQAFLSKTVPTK